MRHLKDCIWAIWKYIRLLQKENVWIKSFSIDVKIRWESKENNIRGGNFKLEQEL